MANNRRNQSNWVPDDAAINDVIDMLDNPDQTAYEMARHAIGQAIYDQIFEALDTRGLEIEMDRRGPNGGISVQIRGFMRLEDGQYYGFATNIYTGDFIERPLLERIAAADKRQNMTNWLENNAPALGNGE